jgi:hypothetical protein
MRAEGEEIPEPRGVVRGALLRIIEDHGRAPRGDGRGYSAPTPPPATTPPSLDHLEWVPDLLGEILRDSGYSAAEKRALMAEVNAAAMRFWAVSAEWASGQRGVAMQGAEQAAKERATAQVVELRGERPGWDQIPTDKVERAVGGTRSDAAKGGKRRRAGGEPG